MFEVETLSTDGGNYRLHRFEHFHAAYAYAEDARDRGLYATLYETTPQGDCIATLEV